MQTWQRVRDLSLDLKKTPVEVHDFPGFVSNRVLLPMLNEAVRCLDEGIIRSARDGDIGAVFGIGFPPFRGGPFHYLEQLGSGYVRERLHALQRRHGTRFSPCEALSEPPPG